MNQLPWSNLTTPSSGYVWKRCVGTGPHPFWWGKDSGSDCVLLFQLTQSDHIETFKKSRPKVSGLAIDIVSVDDGRFQGLLITLKTPSDVDIFHELCLNLIKAAENAETESQAVVSVLQHLDRWREFLSAARNPLLTSDEIRGLFAELTVINLLIDDYSLAPNEVISAWVGPLGKPQDFEFGTGFIEVKSVGGASGNVISISSVYQLDTGEAPLSLVSVELTDSPEIKGNSLNELVDLTLRRLNAETQNQAKSKLSATGYVRKSEYDAAVFQIGKIQAFDVLEGFPSILPRDLKPGVEAVRYKIDLQHAQMFRTSRISLWESSNNV